MKLKGGERQEDAENSLTEFFFYAEQRGNEILNEMKKVHLFFKMSIFFLDIQYLVWLKYRKLKIQ